MLDLTFTQITEWLGFVWWPFVRFSGFFLVVPFFGDTRIPVMVRILLAMIFAIMCAGIIDSVPSFNPFSIQAFIFAIYQFSFGFILGMVVLLFMNIFTIAGQAVSMQMGLAMAVMNDPSSGVSVPITARIFSITSMLLLLSFDAHLIILDIFVDSFRYWPFDTEYPFEGIKHVLTMFGWMFSSALIIAIPAMLTMMLSNVTFGFLGKVAPSLNIFTLGFPMTMLLGMIALMLSIYGVGDIFFDLVSEMRDHMNYVLSL